MNKRNDTMRKITIFIILASIFIILSMQSISSAELEDSQYLNYTIDEDSHNLNIEDASTDNHDFEIEKQTNLKLKAQMVPVPLKISRWKLIKPKPEQLWICLLIIMETTIPK